uniref:Late embryogenesis abundant protein LEA-2 subgroup domain-containing protein n=1 Tax=Leersia perrieri TaxID=77586 RepID=A0A0D9VIE2_9ORYZ
MASYPDEENEFDVWRFVYICCAFAIILPAVGALIWYVVEITIKSQYSVEIGAVVGLDPATDLQGGKGALNLAFNLTVTLAWRSSLRGACVTPGATVTLWYASDEEHPLATGLVPAFCVGPQESREVLVVARGADVSVPGYLLQGLADGIRLGQVMFEFNLVTPVDKENNRIDWCRATVVQKASCNYIGDSPA